MKDFFRRLEDRVGDKDTLLCVGLDPQNKRKNNNIFQELVDWAGKIVEQTRVYAACYKPNIAFYEAYGPEGLRALEHIVRELIPDEIPVIIDAKRSDIGNTAAAYAASLFDRLKADAVTLNPYLGKESVQPFLEYAGKGLFLLCRTSNPGSDALQEVRVCDRQGFEEYYLRVAREVTGWAGNIGLVVAGNNSGALAAVRKMLPDVWLLAPGIGSQGGSIDRALEAGMRKDGCGILLNISRGITQAASPGRAAHEAVEEMRRVKLHLGSRAPAEGDLGSRAPAEGNNDGKKTDSGGGHTAAGKNNNGKETSADLPASKRELILELIRADCFKLGRFTLKSGAVSPFYIDLRLVISHPELMRRTAAAYCELAAGLKYDRLAGIPFAAVPFAAAVSLMLDAPLIFPRMEAKQHGLKKQIEGKYNAGETALLLDDLVATGVSKLQAVDILRDHGLKVSDLVVLIERGLHCARDLKKHGVTLHSYLQISDFISVCREQGMLPDKEYEKILTFLHA
jgi:uridine monophosphate synthetase